MNKSRKNFSAVNLTVTALMVAFMAVSSYINIPIPFAAITITGQTLVVNLVGLLLSPCQAFITMLIYWLLGLAGAPIFSGGTSGPARMLGPSGGYLVGFFLAAVLISLTKGKKRSIPRYLVSTICVGMPTVYLVATVWLMAFASYPTWTSAIVSGALPFIPLDIVKCVAACLMAVPILKALDSFAPSRKIRKPDTEVETEPTENAEG